MKDYFAMLARYNQWANRKLLDAVSLLSEEEYHQPRQAFFGSIHATLNHILVGDRSWGGRIRHQPSGITSLDQELYPDLPQLAQARGQEDLLLIQLVEELALQQIEGDLSYQAASGPQSTPMTVVLAHLFNHATHHRGQIHDMLSQTPVAPPSMDIIYYYRELMAPKL